MDYFRKVFQRLAAAGNPGAEAREAIYAVCRAEVAEAYASDAVERSAALDGLEKAIRRHEVQALFEESLRRP